MNPLEGRYRAILRLLPRSYRAVRESELLDTLMESAPAGRRTPSTREAIGLVGLGIRTWAGRWISPSPTVSRQTTSLLAVLLPLVLVFPAASALTFGVDFGEFWTPQDPNFTALLPSWTLWLVVAALTIVGRPTWPRWVAVLAISTYVGGALAQVADHNYGTGTRTAGWLGFQIVAVFCLVRPVNVRLGRSLLKRRRASGLLIAAGLIGVLYTGIPLWADAPYDPQRRWWFLAVAAVGGLLLFAHLITRPTGRALLPVLGSAAALLCATQNGASKFGNYGSIVESWGVPTTNDVIVLAAVPVTTYIALRLLTALIDTLKPSARPVRR